MGEFVAATLTFPTAVFTFALLVVAGYWLLVAIGATEAFGDEVGETGTAPGFFDALGLGQVPVTVAVTILVSLSWFACLAGTVAIEAAGLDGPAAAVARAGVLAAAIMLAVLATRVIVAPLGRWFRPDSAPSNEGFIGQMCRIRTARVDSGFGQAELISADGSSAIIQVRQSEGHAVTTPLTQGDSAVVYDYDRTTETFWVAPMEGI